MIQQSPGITYSISKLSQLLCLIKEVIGLTSLLLSYTSCKYPFRMVTFQGCLDPYLDCFVVDCFVLIHCDIATGTC